MSKNGSMVRLTCLVVGVLALVSGLAGCPGARKAPAPETDTGKPTVDWPDAGPLQNAEVLKVPFLLWGGDVVTFQANGNLKTQPGSTFDKHGLKLELVPGDDFEAQVKSYLTGESPFLRGTFSMLGTKCDVLGKDPRTRPVIFLQLTWSAGDHLVARSDCKTLSDLKGKKIALQKDGPHVGMLDDILRTARLTWRDVRVEWTDDVSGDKGPAELFRKDHSLDACFAITPDMVGLTGGLDKTGDGKDKTVPEAHVLVSTADMKRSIADVYACRKDFYDAHRDVVERFAAGYLKACEGLVEMKKEQKKTGASAEYKKVLALAQEIYGKDPKNKDAVASDADADGLISDAVFVGLPGNKSFFTDPGNLSGFQVKQDAVLDLAVNEGYARSKSEFLKPDAGFYERLKGLGQLAGQAPPENRFRNDLKLLDENTIYSFNISFQANQSTFDEKVYGEDFKRALMQASLFGNAVMAIRGHADSYNLVKAFLEAAQQKQIIRPTGGRDQYTVVADGSALDLNNMKKVAELINKHNLTGAGDADPRGLVQGLLTLSNERADKVRQTVIGYAQSRGYRLDKSQIRAVGVGALEPVVAYPRGNEEMARNRRVEFRLIRVAADQRGEAISESDFDY